jgi:hypothetical protein
MNRQIVNASILREGALLGKPGSGARRMQPRTKIPDPGYGRLRPIFSCPVAHSQSGESKCRLFPSLVLTLSLVGA